jgi:hypothetical protein
MPDSLTPEQKQAEIDRLEAKLAASQAQGSGYGDRIRAIEAKLETLKNG